jgi:hypothetical protein
VFLDRVEFLQRQKLVTQNFVAFENKKWKYEGNGVAEIVECFTLYLVVLELIKSSGNGNRDHLPSP